jgi:uncharacterized protein (DUF1330 family)
MSAYVITEFTVKDPDVVREKYGPNAAQTAKEHGGEVLANSNWEILHGDPMLSSAAIMRFPDHETAVRWYNSPEYQQLIDVRSVAMDARFSLLDGLPNEDLSDGRSARQHSRCGNARAFTNLGLSPGLAKCDLFKRKSAFELQCQ